MVDKNEASQLAEVLHDLIFDFDSLKIVKDCKAVCCKRKKNV